MALLDTVRDKLKQPGLDQPPGAGEGLGQTETVRGLLSAKTGKAQQPSAGPRQSALQEQLAAAQTAAGQEQLAAKGELQSEQFAQRELDITQRAQQQEQLFQDHLRNMQDGFIRQSNNLLDQFSRGQKSLTNQRDIGQMEQIGFGTRLANEQYINQLRDQGQRSRLDNEVEFKKQIAKNLFESQQHILNNQIAFDRIVSADDREFAEELAQIDINYAMDVADSEIKSAGARQVATGVGAAATAGIQAAAASGIFNSNSEASTGASGEANPGEGS